MAGNKKSGRKPKPEGQSVTVSTRLAPREADALKAYLAAQEIEVRPSQVVAAAVREFLEKRGYLGSDST